MLLMETSDALQSANANKQNKNKQVYCTDVNEQRKQMSNDRYKVFDLTADDIGDILCYQVMRDVG